MDILNDIWGFASGPARPFLEWGASIAIGGTIGAYVRSELKKIGTTLILETNHKLEDISDPDLREMIRYGIRYVAKRFPDASGNRKLELLVNAIQNATPNFIISDDEIRKIIQEEYDQIKGDLSKI